MLEDIPRHTTSFIDFLGEWNINKRRADTNSFKLNPTKCIALKETGNFEQMESTLGKLFYSAKKNEYWKAKTGIFSFPITVDGEPEDKTKKLKGKKKVSTQGFSYKIKRGLNYSLMDDKEEWEFLYKTGKYDYTFVGGTKIKGEDVFIIDFTPKRSGLYQGRVYITKNTSALIKATYEYAEGRQGTNFSMLGVGQSDNLFQTTIIFNKQNDSYQLKYLSYSKGGNTHIDRKLSLIKKRKRFLIGKTLNEFKVDVKYSIDTKFSIEILVLEEINISRQEFANFQQKKKFEINFVDQFDDELWEGYDIIEPTKRMKEYQKAGE